MSTNSVLSLPVQTLSEVASAWKAGELAKTSDARRTSRPIWAKNTGTSVLANRPVKIVGFSSTLTYANAYKKMLAGNLALEVQPATSGSSVVVTSSPIANGKFGTVEGDITFGVVEFSNASHTYATETFASSADESVFKIVAKSAASSNKAVCALLRVSGGGGGTSEVEVKRPLWKDSDTACGGLFFGLPRGDTVPSGYNPYPSGTVPVSSACLYAGKGLEFYRAYDDTEYSAEGKVIGVRIKGSTMDVQTGTFVTSVTPTSTTLTIPTLTEGDAVTGIDTTTQSVINELRYTNGYAIGEIDSTSGTGIVSITTETATVVTDVDAATDTAITSVSTSTGQFVTTVSTETGTFVTSVTPTNATVVGSITTTPGTFVTAVSTTTEQVVQNVTATEVDVLTSLKYRSGQVVQEVLAATDTAIKSISAPTTSVVTSLTTTTKTVVTAASLVVDETAAGGGIQFVTGVECVNGQIVVHTAYLRLSVTTEQVDVVTGKVDGTAIASITPTPTPVVTSATGKPTFAVLSLDPSTGKGAVNIQAPKVAVLKTATGTTGNAITAVTPTSATVVGSLTAPTSTALTSATGTTSAAVTEVTTDDGSFVTSVTPTTGSVIGDVDTETGSFLTAVEGDADVPIIYDLTGGFVDVIKTVTPTKDSFQKTATTSQVNVVQSVTTATDTAITDIL